jgi:SHS2 domain-containing protein
MSFTNDYEIIDHTADIGIRVRGNSLNSVIKKAVLALSDLMSGQMKIDRDEEKEFKIHEDEPDIAMVRILEEVLYLFEHQKFAVSDCRASIDNNDYIIELKGRL